MKAHGKIKMVAWLLMVCNVFAFSLLSAQEAPIKARLSVEYHKTMGENGYLLITSKYKEDKKYHPAKSLSLNVYQMFGEDSSVLIGEALTNAEGEARFALETASTAVDSILEFKYEVRIEENEKFKDADKSVKFYDAFLKAEVITEDSVDFVVAELLNGMGEPMEGEDIDIMVQRLFAPLRIGESSFETDDDGKIKVEIEEPIPSKTGELTFEVIFEGRKYGIVKDVVESKIGMEMADMSTYDQRTMWSPPGKTPIFLLVLANMLILGIWSVIGIIVFNLFKITKS